MTLSKVGNFSTEMKMSETNDNGNSRLSVTAITAWGPSTKATTAKPHAAKQQMLSTNVSRVAAQAEGSSDMDRKATPTPNTSSTVNVPSTKAASTLPTR